MLTTSPSYVSLLKELYSLQASKGMKLGLDNMHKMLELLHRPDLDFSVVHVAGSNGKGSVCEKVASALQMADIDVGLFTSPHVSSFRERIRMNGEPASEQEVEQTLTRIMGLAKEEGVPLTFFELTTLLAFQLFSERNVEVAVVEVGLGGRLDATNAIEDAILSIITSITLEHQEWLGETIEEIAAEKAEILRPVGTALIGPSVPKAVVEKKARIFQSDLHQVPGSFDDPEEEARAIAEEAIDLLRTEGGYFTLEWIDVEEALRAQPPCRFEEVEGVILDVAHNPAALEKLFQKVKREFPDKPIRAVVGLCKDKDIEGCLRILSDACHSVHFVQASHKRACSSEELYAQLPSDLHPDEKGGSLEETFTNAQWKAQAAGEQLVVCGSFLIMAPIRRLLGIEEPRDPVELNEQL